MALELTGTLVQILPEVTGEGTNGPWRKTSFVIEMDDKFKKKVCFLAWGDKIDDLKRYSPGNQVTVGFDIESRSYNERWYTDAKMWKIEGIASPQTEPIQTGGYDGPPVSTPSSDDDLPF